jgi:predicted DNA-binding protein (MmcQ/YjbR family)
MDIEGIRRCCLSFPHATENVQWGYDLCFKIDGKLFAVTPLEPAPVRLSFKASAENFMELCERTGIIPAPYMARAQWVALQQLDALPDSELRELLAESYRLVFERLPKMRQQELQSAPFKTSSTGKAKKTAKKTTVKSKPAKASKKKAAKKKPAKAGRTK